VKLATEAGVEGFVKTAAPQLVEVGGWSADLIRRFRLKSALKTIALAQGWLREAGLDPKKVTLKVLVPWFEYGSLEDDPEEAVNPDEAQAMRERWAALLANSVSV
jgi:hypothetical protein